MQAQLRSSPVLSTPPPHLDPLEQQVRVMMWADAKLRRNYHHWRHRKFPLCCGLLRCTSLTRTCTDKVNVFEVNGGGVIRIESRALFYGASCQINGRGDVLSLRDGLIQISSRASLLLCLFFNHFQISPCVSWYTHLNAQPPLVAWMWLSQRLPTADWLPESGGKEGVSGIKGSVCVQD